MVTKTQAQPKTKAGAARTTTSTRPELADALQTLLDPFGWKVDRNKMPHLQAAELDAISTWLDDVWVKTPMAVWQLVMIPNGQWIKFFKNANDAMAIVSTIFSDRGEFTLDEEDPVARLIDSIDESGYHDTRFGGLFLEAAPELQLWFGRKAGKATPDLSGDGARNAIVRLFGKEPKAESGKPAAKSTTKLSDVAAGEQKCRVCGCTEVDCRQCVEATGEPCHWIETDLCSRCDSSTKPAKPVSGSAKKKLKHDDADAAKPELAMIDVAMIQQNPENHRKDFESPEAKQALKELAESIRQHGVLQPLLLRRVESAPGLQLYQIIAGERRYRAAKLAGLETVPAQIVERDGLQASLAMLEENIRREDLNPIERANAIRSLMTDYRLTQKEVGQMMPDKITQGQVSNELRLLELPPTLQAEVASGAIAPTLIRSVLPYTDLPDVLEALTKKLLADGGPYTEDRLSTCLSSSILASSRSMQLQDGWQSYRAPDPKDRHFTEPSKADLKALAVRKVEALDSWQGQERTFNVELFDQLNAEPLAARRKKHAAWKAKNKSTTSVYDSSKKGKAKTAAVIYFDSEYKVREAIEAGLSNLLANAFERSKDKSVNLRVMLAVAVLTEGQIADALTGTSASSPQGTQRLLDALDAPALPDIMATFRAAAIKVMRENSFAVEDCYCYGAVLGIKLWEHWTVTPDVLATLTDAGRAEFVDQEPGHIPDFMRPFFALKSDAPKGKAKKGKAA